LDSAEQLQSARLPVDNFVENFALTARKPRHSGLLWGSAQFHADPSSPAKPLPDKGLFKYAGKVQGLYGDENLYRAAA
jgi:hypothetical protein